MKTPVVLLALILAALIWSQTGVASYVAGRTVPPDVQSILLETSSENPVTYEGSSGKNKSKLRTDTKKCSKRDKDCNDE